MGRRKKTVEAKLEKCVHQSYSQGATGLSNIFSPVLPLLWYFFLQV